MSALKKPAVLLPQNIVGPSVFRFVSRRIPFFKMAISVFFSVFQKIPLFFEYTNP